MAELPIKNGFGKKPFAFHGQLINPNEPPRLSTADLQDVEGAVAAAAIMTSPSQDAANYSNLYVDGPRPSNYSYCNEIGAYGDGDDRTLDGSVDLKGRPVSRSRTGGIKAAGFIIGVELAERLAYYGIASNLVLYLTGKMRESKAEAFRNYTNWVGVTLVIPVVGGFFADAYWGRYWTIAAVSVVYLMGMVLLTLAVSIHPLKPAVCAAGSTTCPPLTSAQVGVFYLALYLISVGTGGIKPCLEAFGADQYDDEEPRERKRKSSFFNWWYFALCTGGLISVTVLVWLDQNVSWSLGYGIPTIVMAFACVLFFAGTPRYRHKLPGGSPLTQVAQVLVAALRNWNAKMPSNPASLHEVFRDPAVPSARRQLEHTDKFRFLDRAAVIVGGDHSYSQPKPSKWALSTVTQVEEVKLIARVIPVWLSTFAYGVVFVQTSSTFQFQATAMVRKLGKFTVPEASYQALATVTVLALLPLYDRVFVPVARRITGHERGITMLQRIGSGLALSVLVMVVAAVVEAKRRTSPEPLSAFWLTPQYFLIGVADVLTLVGEQEFFYDQVPDSMRSLGMALYLSANGVGSFINSLLVTIVTSAVTSSGHHQPWIQNNANASRYDLYYWMLAVISALNFVVFILVARSYRYKHVRSPVDAARASSAAPHTGLSHKDVLQRYHNRPSNASSTASY